ncbi:alginate lyase family protein [Pseudochrobactrum asaccharolyticum]|uniref:Alginate lyase n=1 Tax=Pseudochrobactrum asaccharolyticum TaxID=354351 RepID=A0A366E9X4_9HYPH|nr:alginate lyase family protein [Pseudochrobactrum asaccharolyticum]RBO98569.1 alginate lyase [Pseudochrobactrum asaccharolyticum]
MKKTTFSLLIAGFLLFPLSHAVASNCSIRPSDFGKLISKAEKELNLPPAPRAHLHTEGTLPGQGIFDQSSAAKADFQRMYIDALAYSADGDTRFLKKARTYLQEWQSVYKLNFNPIDETQFGQFIKTFILISTNLSPKERQQTEAFLHNLAAGYSQNIKRTENSGHNAGNDNWQSHRIKLFTLAAVALHDAAMLNQAQVFFDAQVAGNIRPDGSVKDYYERDALHYVTYDLEPLTEAAIAARSAGRDWLDRRSTTGSTLRAAINWLVPYAEGRKEHTEFVHSKVRFDRIRREAGVKAEQIALWPSSNSIRLYWLASQLDDTYKPLAASFQADPPLDTLSCTENHRKT